MDIGGMNYNIASDDDYPTRTGAIFEPDTVELIEEKGVRFIFLTTSSVLGLHR